MGRAFWLNGDNATPETAGELCSTMPGKEAKTIPRELRGELCEKGTLTGTVAFLRVMPWSQPVDNREEDRNKHLNHTFLSCFSLSDPH